MSTTPPPLSTSTASPGVSPMAHVLWSICKCRYTANDFYGTDVSFIDVPQLHRNVAARVSVTASPQILLIVSGRFVGAATKLLFKQLGLQVTVCLDPLVAYHKYLAPSRRPYYNFDLVIADWGIGNPTTALDLVHFVRRDGNHRLCFVALCGHDVLAGAAIRSGADLFLRKPLLIHSITLQRLLLPRAMSLPGFPVVLLRQQANHEQLKAVFDAYHDDEDNRSTDPSYAGGTRQHAHPQPHPPLSTSTGTGGLGFLAAASSSAAATQRLVDEITEEVEMEELEGDDDGSSLFVNDMISYLKAQDPKHANDRWHKCLQSSMEALQHAKDALKRVSEEASVCRRQAEVCWQQHRDVPVHMMSDHIVSGISRRELILRCLQLARRNEELERSLHLSECSYQDICRDSASLKAATQAILDEYQQQQQTLRQSSLPPLSSPKRKKKKPQQVAPRRRDSLETSSLSVDESGDTIATQEPSTVVVGGSQPRIVGGPSRATGAGRGLTPTTDRRSPASSRNSGTPSQPVRATVGRPPPLKPKGPGTRDPRRGKPATTTADPLYCRLSASLERMLMAREDMDSTAVAQLKVPDQIAFRLSWPPLLRNQTTAQVVPLYHSVRGLLQGLLSECTLMSQRMLAVAPTTLTWLEEFESAVHGVLGSDPAAIFETPMSPASDSGSGSVGGRHRKAAAMHDGGSDVHHAPVVPHPPASTAEGSFRSSGSPLARGLQQQQSLSGSYTAGGGGKKLVGKTASEIHGFLHAAMLRQAATMETRVSCAHLASRFFLWQGYVRGSARAKEQAVASRATNTSQKQAESGADSSGGAVVGMVPSASDEATPPHVTGEAENPAAVADTAETAAAAPVEEGQPAVAPSDPNAMEVHSNAARSLAEQAPQPVAVQEKTAAVPAAPPKRAKPTTKSSSLEAPQAAPLRVA